MNLDDLLKRARAGDKSAENAIFTHLAVRFRSFAKQINIDEQDADDLAQEACFKVISKYKEEEFTSSFESWAHGVLRNTIGNFFQKRKLQKNILVFVRGEEAVNEASKPEENYDLRFKLIDCIRKLIPTHRQYIRALNLTQQGYKVQEICEKLNVTSDNLYVILNRGRSLLKNCLEKGL